MGMIVCLSVAHQYSSSKARITFMATDRLILQNYINNGLNLFFFLCSHRQGKTGSASKSWSFQSFVWQGREDGLSIILNIICMH